MGFGARDESALFDRHADGRWGGADGECRVGFRAPAWRDGYWRRLFRGRGARACAGSRSAQFRLNPQRRKRRKAKRKMAKPRKGRRRMPRRLPRTLRKKRRRTKRKKKGNHRNSRSKRRTSKKLL